MYKIILFTVLSAVFMMLYAYQIDHEMAVNTLFRAKYALNRTTHAAAQQLDLEKYAIGLASIDADNALSTATTYLQANLNLDQDNMPLPNTFLRSRIEMLEFVVINEQEQFPYLYSNPTYDYEVKLDKPGVVMIIRVVYPRTFNVLGPIVWEIKSASEIVNMVN